MNNTTIYFIRHAESPFIFGAERERPLSEKGYKDSIEVAAKLTEVHFDKLFRVLILEQYKPLNLLLIKVRLLFMMS